MIRYAVWLLACSLSLVLHAQDPLTIGEVRTLSSSALGEDRTLNIVLPHGYANNDTTRYPVVFVLDGSMDEDLLHVTGAMAFAGFPWIAWQRPSIVVGIATVDRRRDFTYPTTVAEDKEMFPTTGGSFAFIDFLGKELLPFVDAHYRTLPDRLLIGQSLGGLLASEVLLTRAELFQRYLIVSPSLWWDNGSLLQRSASFGSAHVNARVVIAVGKEGRVMERDAKRLYTLVCSNKAVRTELLHFPRHDHATIMYQAVIDGLRQLGAQ